MKVLNIIVAAAASMALMAACSSKTGSAAAEASQNDTVAVAAPAEAVIEVAAGDTALSFSTPLAVIDFNATWCGPCQQFKPVFHKVAAKYADRITFFSVDTDSCPRSQCSIRRSPSRRSRLSAPTLWWPTRSARCRRLTSQPTLSRCFSKPTIHDNTKNASCTELCTGSVFS